MRGGQAGRDSRQSAKVERGEAASIREDRRLHDESEREVRDLSLIDNVADVDVGAVDQVGGDDFGRALTARGEVVAFQSPFDGSLRVCGPAGLVAPAILHARPHDALSTHPVLVSHPPRDELTGVAVLQEGQDACQMEEFRRQLVRGMECSRCEGGAARAFLKVCERSAACKSGLQVRDDVGL